MPNFYSFNLKSHNDSRGKMIVGESLKDIPFIIKRFFFSFDSSDEHSMRGCHANIKSKFVFVCLQGSCLIKVDDGLETEIFELSDPSVALFIDSLVWKEMYNFSSDCILLILSDCLYDKDEYIYSFDAFYKLVQEKRCLSR